MKKIDTYSDESIELAYQCGVKAAQSGFPNIGLYNQFHVSHRPLYDAWLDGHNSVTDKKDIAMKITAKYFEEKTGFKPIQDDLERSNCKEAGEIGHQSCGWCDSCERPLFMGHEENCKEFK